MSQTIEELLAALRREYEATLEAAEENRRRAARHEQDAQIIAARIQGVEETLALLSPAGNGAEPAKPRRPYRDIKALVKTYLDVPRSFALPGDKKKRAEFIADQIGDCRSSQVAKALAAIEAEGGA